MYIVVVFENEEFGKFECDNSFEEFNGELFIIEIFLVFSSGDMKDLNASVTLYRTVILTNLIIWLIMTSDRVNS
jgi:hypothetical protein